jgi:hypothetical protein
MAAFLFRLEMVDGIAADSPTLRGPVARAPEVAIELVKPA